MINTKDLTTALYSLSRAKSYSTTIVLTLGVTLGALVAMFSLNYQLLATPLPYPDADRLYVVSGNLYHDKQLKLENMSQYPPLIDTYKNNTHFAEKALAYFWEDVIRSLPDTPRVNVTYVTPEYLKLADAPLALGRHFSPDEGLDSYTPVAVLSYESWKTLFNLDPNVLDQTVRFGEVEFRIVGVTKKDFVEPQIFLQGRKTNIWLPWDYNDTPEQSRNSWLGFSEFRFLVGKLKSSSDPNIAEHELTTSINSRYQDALSGRSSQVHRSTAYRLSLYEHKIVGDSTTRTLLMMAGVLALLLIAAANITNLILARAANQQRTMAIQVALGAQKKHIFGNLLSEICLLMMAAAFMAIIMAGIGIELLKGIAADQIPRVQELTLNWQTCLFAVLVALLLAVLFASLVSRQINYRMLNSMLQSSGKGAGIQISGRVRNLLIISQVALTGVLLAASLQIFFQANRYISQPLGFKTSNIQVMTLNIGNLRNTAIEERQSYMKAIRERLLLHPKVVNASLSLNTPISLSRPLWITTLATDASRQNFVTTATTVIDENYLTILGFPLLTGRHLTTEEFNDNSRLIIVNQTLARQLDSTGDVLGKQYYWRGPAPYQVIGIVKDASLPGKVEPPRMFVRGMDANYPLIMLQFKPGQPLSSAELNNEFSEINSQYKVSEIFTLEDAKDLLLAKDRISVWLTSGLALLALSLAAIGIYGVLSYSVQLRRFELGIRMAIGARPSTVFLQILHNSFVPVLIGLGSAIAVLAALWLWVNQSSYQLEPTFSGWVIPILLVLVLTAATSLLSVWKIISKPAINALRNS